MQNYQPKSISEAVDYILAQISEKDENIDFLESFVNDEEAFVSNLHMFFGRNIRNEWHLWWYSDHNYKGWSKEIPSIVKEFNDLQIYHADDMSSIILASTYRKFFNLPLNMEEQIKIYHKHWISYCGNIDFRKSE